MEYLWVYIILIIGGLVGTYIAGKRKELKDFMRELGEAFIATSDYLGIDKPTPEDAEKFKKEWVDAIRAGGSLFKRIIEMAKKARNKRMGY